jgi:hypothetical protein
MTVAGVACATCLGWLVYVSVRSGHPREGGAFVGLVGASFLGDLVGAWHMHQHGRLPSVAGDLASRAALLCVGVVLSEAWRLYPLLVILIAFARSISMVAAAHAPGLWPSISRRRLKALRLTQQLLLALMFWTALWPLLRALLIDEGWM